VGKETIHELDDVDLRLSSILGKAWTERDTPDRVPLSTQIALVLWCPDRRGPGKLSQGKTGALRCQYQKALDIEAGRKGVI
jgi:hypothetical protein